jgi:hypothetical protein
MHYNYNDSEKVSGPKEKQAERSVTIALSVRRHFPSVRIFNVI